MCLHPRHWWVSEKSLPSSLPSLLLLWGLLSGIKITILWALVVVKHSLPLSALSCLCYCTVPCYVNQETPDLFLPRNYKPSVTLHPLWWVSFVAPALPPKTWHSSHGEPFLFRKDLCILIYLLPSLSVINRTVRAFTYLTRIYLAATIN